VLVFSIRPRASRSSDFEIARAITPCIVLHSVQLLLLTRTEIGLQMLHTLTEFLQRFVLERFGGNLVAWLERRT